MSTARTTFEVGSEVPRFEPHPWIRGGNAQTIVARYLPGKPVRLVSTAHHVAIGNDEHVNVLESIPTRWKVGDPSALLVHGLGGCARSPYILRTAQRFVKSGIRVVRMNLRGAGSGFGLARGFYHAGRSGDLRQVVAWMQRRALESPIGLVGFSLGANLVLKLAAEAATEPLPAVDCVVAANPPMDLAACCLHLQKPSNRLYDWNFVKLLRAEVRRLHSTFPELGRVDLSRVRSLYEFDDVYTAPRNGFANATDYYLKSSAAPLLSQIRMSGLVVHAADDPFIPVEVFHRFVFPSQLSLELVPSGGHLGYFSRTSWEGDRRWLEARLTAWLKAHWRI